MARPHSAAPAQIHRIVPSTIELSSPPRWWSMKGSGMRFLEMSTDHQVLVIASDPRHPVAKLTISPSKTRKDCYTMRWRVVHEDGDTLGCVDIWGNQLRCAFGYRGHKNPGIDDVTPSGQAMADLIDSLISSGDQGIYFRLGPYLNIPCPGTGMQGDPNISILVTKELWEAIDRLRPEPPF